MGDDILIKYNCRDYTFDLDAGPRDYKNGLRAAVDGEDVVIGYGSREIRIGRDAFVGEGKEGQEILFLSDHVQFDRRYFLYFMKDGAHVNSKGAPISIILKRVCGDEEAKDAAPKAPAAADSSGTAAALQPGRDIETELAAAIYVMNSWLLHDVHKKEIIIKAARAVAATGNREQMLPLLQRLKAQAEKIGDPDHRCMALARIAGVLAAAGFTNEAKEPFKTAEDIADKKRESDHWKTLDYLEIGKSYTEAGLREKAHTIFQKAVKSANKITDPSSRVFYLTRTAEELTAAGYKEEADTLFFRER